jgi:hypothetical protein
MHRYRAYNSKPSCMQLNAKSNCNPMDLTSSHRQPLPGLQGFQAYLEPLHLPLQCASYYNTASAVTKPHKNR